MEIKEFPETARDIDRFVKDNLDKRGNFVDGSVLNKLGAFCIFFGEWNGRGKPYSATLEFTKKEGRGKDEKHGTVWITISQTDTTIETDGPLFSPTEIYGIAAGLDKALRPYEFTPVAYELWSDHPDTPYYIRSSLESLCRKVVTKKKTEETNAEE